MTKRASIGLPLLAFVLFALCILPLLFLSLFLLPVGALTSQVVLGPAEKFTDPETYARDYISTSEHVNEEEVEIVQIQTLNDPATLWVILTRFNQEGSPNTQLLSMYKTEDVLNKNFSYSDNFSENPFFNTTFNRYRAKNGVQFSIHGTIHDPEIAQVTISFHDKWQESAIIEDNTFLLFDHWPIDNERIENIKVTALDKDDRIISEIIFNEPPTTQ